MPRLRKVTDGVATGIRRIASMPMTGPSHKTMPFHLNQLHDHDETDNVVGQAVEKRKKDRRTPHNRSVVACILTIHDSGTNRIAHKKLLQTCSRLDNIHLSDSNNITMAKSFRMQKQNSFVIDASRRKQMESNIRPAVPPKFKCALTKQLMKDPLATKYGDNFEKEVIVNWFNSGNRVCPLSGKPLECSEVISNRALKAQIKFWLEEQREEEKCEQGSPRYKRDSSIDDTVDVFMISPVPVMKKKSTKKKGLTSLIKNVLSPSPSSSSLKSLQ